VVRKFAGSATPPTSQKQSRDLEQQRHLGCGPDIVSMRDKIEPEYRLVISSSIMAHANNSLNENQQRVNIVESKAQVPESDASQVVKNLELQQINYKYSDL
jgi:hypothetical protein